MTIPIRLNLVTLGVADLARACAFYAAMGLERREEEAAGVAFFLAGPVVLSLYPRDRLAEDADLEVDLEAGPSAPAFRGLSLACNVAEAGDVAVVIARAEAAGGSGGRTLREAGAGGVLGRNQRLLRRPGRPPLGSRPQPLLSPRQRGPADDPAPLRRGGGRIDGPCLA